MSQVTPVTPVPKLVKGGLSRTVLHWIAFAGLVFFIAMGIGAWAKHVRTQDGVRKTIINQHTGEADPMIAMSLIGDIAPAPEPEPEPEPAEEPVALPEPLEEVIAYIPPPSASDLFRGAPQDFESVESLVASINDSRRGKVVAKSAKDMFGKGSNTRDEYSMKDDSWAGMDRTDTSFPVDMERVIPLTSNISALLVNEIHSERGGKVTAQVEQHIYGGQGRKVLIPAGSEAVGYFTPLEKIGEERITITWVRIITPEGINIYTGNAEMADAMGRTGLTGYMDNKYPEKYGIPLLVTTLQVASAYAFPVKSQNQAVIVEGYGSSMSNMGQRVLDETMQIKPIVEIPAGSRINISILKDIWFPEPVKKTIKAAPMEAS
jgi:type IV secretion system protein VirB10